MNTKESTLKNDLIHVIAGQARRQDEAAGRLDASGFESYGKIKNCLEQVTEAVKPLDKTLKEYWKQVAAGDGDTQAAYLQELETEATAALAALVRLTATADRALWALHPWRERKIGQMSFDELMDGEPDFEDLDETAMPEVDEETGEVVEEELDYDE